MQPLATAAIALTLALTPVANGGAQGTPLPSAPGTISGAVLDAMGAPVPGAEVFYGDDRVRVVAGADGAFRFAGVRRGEYTVTARHIGYLPQSREVTVGDSGATVRFTLVSTVSALPPVVTRARRSGLAGIVTDSAFHPLPGAFVEAAGGAAGTAETDSSGRYHINAAEGHYFLRVSRDGYRSVSVSLNVKRDEGRYVNFRLIPDSNYSLIREREAAFAMRQRLALRSPSRSRVYTRADIAQLGARSLDDLVRRSGLIGSACLATINGGLERTPAWAIDIADVEFLEVYEGTPGAVPRAGSGAPLEFRSCSVAVFVWVRR